MSISTIEQIKRHEGFRQRVYKCTAGKDTIGYGYNITANPLKLTKFEIDGFYSVGINEHVASYLLLRLVNEIDKSLSENFDWFESLNEARQAVLVNMCFNLGLNGLLGFKTTLAMVKAGYYELAAENMLKSKWAGQVHGRALELALQMRTGEFK